MVWASNGYWYVGKRDELGKQAGWMQVRDSAPLPEEITASGRFGTRWPRDGSCRRRSASLR